MDVEQAAVVVVFVGEPVGYGGACEHCGSQCTVVQFDTGAERQFAVLYGLLILGKR